MTITALLMALFRRRTSRTGSFRQVAKAVVQAFPDG